MRDEEKLLPLLGCRYVQSMKFYMIQNTDSFVFSDKIFVTKIYVVTDEWPRGNTEK